MYFSVTFRLTSSKTSGIAKCIQRAKAVSFINTVITALFLTIIWHCS